MDAVRVSAFRAEDRADLEALLKAAELPTEDLTPAMLADFLVARRGASMVGAAGLERHAKDGLLRSVVVEKSLRGAGLGRRLVTSMEDRARGHGLKQLFLLTTSADDFFRSLGYLPLGRDAAPPGIRNSRQFSELCPSTSSFMTKRLK
jgi:amino-acid N-acetyltransferase